LFLVDYLAEFPVNLAFSALTLLAGRQEGRLACRENCAHC